MIRQEVAATWFPTVQLRGEEEVKNVKKSNVCLVGATAVDRFSFYFSSRSVYSLMKEVWSVPTLLQKAPSWSHGNRFTTGTGKKIEGQTKKVIFLPVLQEGGGPRHRLLP